MPTQTVKYILDADTSKASSGLKSAAKTAAKLGAAVAAVGTAFFAFQKHHIEPDLITIAKGMGNGFPIGGVLIHPKIEASYGLLGTTFGGNHLACRAGLAVLEVIEKEQLLVNVKNMNKVFIQEATQLQASFSIKGRGLMLGLEFNFPIAQLRQQLLKEHHIFTGSSKNPNVMRLLPSLTVQEHHIKQFFEALSKVLSKEQLNVS